MDATQKIDDFSLTLKNIVVAHECTYYINSVYDCPKGRSTYGLIYILSGELDYRFYDGRTLKVKAGDTFLLKPNDGYKVTSPTICRHYTVNFLLSRAPITGDVAKRVFLAPDTTILGKEDSDRYQLDEFEELCSVWSEKAAGYQIRAMSLLYNLL